MTSTFSFIKNNSLGWAKDKWRALDSAWRFSILAYLIARLALSAWTILVAAIFPLVVSNFYLHGEPIVTAFDLHTSRRAVFSRVLDGRELHFRTSPPNLIDVETNSVWDLNGRAISGTLSGSSLGASTYSPEEVFPYRGIEPSQNTLLSVWQRFDTNWYLKIARSGYGEDGSTVYFPLYSFLIRVFGTLFLGRDLFAAMIISNLALLGALYFLFQIARDLVGEENAKRTFGFFVLFPTAFFLFAPYTEALFLLFVLRSLRDGIHGRWNRAGVFGSFAALTRLQGVLIIVPLAYLAWRDFRKQTLLLAERKPQISLFAPLLLIPLSTFTFFAFTNLSLFNAYESELHARFVFPWENLSAAIVAIANRQASLIDALNLFFAFLFGIMVFAVWIKLPREFGLYSFAMFLAPLFRMTTEQPLVSMARYALVIFPVFILWGSWARNAWFGRVIAYLSLPLQLYLSAQFVMWGWVG